MNLPRLRTLGLLVVTAALGACASTAETITLRQPNLMERLTPYKVDIHQGNVVTREQLALVQTGMNRDQVRELLGSPMLTDVFHANRWDYVYASVRHGNRPPAQRSIQVHFKNEVVERVVAPAEVPTEHQFVANMVDPRRAQVRAPALELTPEQRAKLPVTVRAESTALPVPQGAARTYPPLEGTR